jgi:hypothetical protein
VFIANETNPRVSVSFDDFHTPVGGPVVDNQKLEIAKILPENTLDRIYDECFAVVDGHQHGDQGR